MEELTQVKNFNFSFFLWLVYLNRHDVSINKKSKMDKDILYQVVMSMNTIIQLNNSIANVAI